MSPTVILKEYEQNFQIIWVHWEKKGRNKLKFTPDALEAREYKGDASTIGIL